MFADQHILTSLFVSSDGPVPNKHFLGHLRTDEGQWAEFFVPDNLLGWRLGSNISVYYSEQPVDYLYVTDTNGFSTDVDDPQVALEKSVDTYRVIVLGGSTVMGDGAPLPSQNIVSMLRKGVRERKLTGSDGRHIEFINAGVGGYNSAQEYLYFLSDLLRFKPDLVIVYDGWNDSVYNINKYVSPFRTEAHREITRRITRSYSTTGSASLIKENLIYHLTNGNFRLGIVELPKRVFLKLLKPSSETDYLNSTSIPWDPLSIEYYRYNRRAFLALADEQLSVALFLQPLVGIDGRTLSDEEKGSWWYPKLDESLGNRIPFYERARVILAGLEERGHDGRVCIADLSHSLSGISEPVYADTGHLLPKGNEIVASHMIDKLVLCGLLR